MVHSEGKYKRLRSCDVCSTFGLLIIFLGFFSAAFLSVLNQALCEGERNMSRAPPSSYWRNGSKNYTIATTRVVVSGGGGGGGGEAVAPQRSNKMTIKLL